MQRDECALEALSQHQASGKLCRASQRKVQACITRRMFFGVQLVEFVLQCNIFNHLGSTPPVRLADSAGFVHCV